jgi:hypothetical protein
MARPYAKCGLLTRFLIVCFGSVIGVVLGVGVAVPLELWAAARAADALRAEGQSVCGLIVVGPLFEGVVVGTALGGLGGLVASLLLVWLGPRWWAGRRNA